MKKFLKNAIYILPHPFKSFQKYFQIEEEVSQLKAYFRPYKFSLVLFFTLLSYPIMKPVIQRYAEPTKKRLINAFSAVNQNQIETSSKQIIESILNDPEIKKEGALYVENLTKETIVKEAVVKLLESSVKDPYFIKASKDLAKEIGLDLTKDKEIEKNFADLTLKTLQNSEVKQEASNLVKWVFLQEETKEKLVDLMKSGFEDDRLRNSLTGALSSSFYEILNQQETIEKLKMFSYFLMENDPEESENLRSIIDTIVEKVINKKREDSRKTELEQILETEKIEKESENLHKKTKVL